MSSIALARGGYSEAALAGAIGSQVINLTIGVGAPSLIACIMSSSGSYSVGLKQARR